MDGKATADRQGAILAFILRTCSSRGGTPPTIREICRATGIGSTSVVAYHLGRLEHHGIIRLPQDGVSSRGIEVVGATWTPPAHLAHLVATGEAAAA